MSCALGVFSLMGSLILSVSLSHTWNDLKEEEVVSALFTSDRAKGTYLREAGILYFLEQTLHSQEKHCNFSQKIIAYENT